MKRSEMIAFMYAAYNYALTSDYKEYRETPMTYVLQVIEEEGMLPPARWREHNWNERGITYAQWIQEPSKVNEWEPENE